MLQKESLLQTLDECSDNDNYKNLLLDLPFIKNIMDNNFNIQENKLEDLLESLQTYSYLNIDSKIIVDEIIWRIGEEEELFNKYFEEIDWLQYNIKNSVDNIIKCEFKRNIKFPCRKEKLSARFYK